MNIEELKEYFRYEPETGKLFWNKRPSNRVIRTSIVVKKHEDGSFEILNTLYVPDKEKHEQS
jgi:hypothetical protein